MGSTNAPSGTKRSVFRHVGWEHLAAGVSGGVASTVILHPLDLIKIRFQVNEGLETATATATARPKYNGIIHAFSTITRTEGIRGLYQGITPNVWGAGASWGLYFLFYNTCKAWMLEQNPESPVLKTSQHMSAACAAGVLTLSVTNPIWVAKTRLCLQYDTYTAPQTANTVTHYKGTMDCLMKVATQEGIRGLYKGFLPGLVGVSHGVVQFVAYEDLQKRYNKYRQVPLDTKFSTVEYIGFAAVSKIIAATTTYPYQVVRSRLQDQHRTYAGMWDVISQTYRQEAIRGFYKGLAPYLLHVTPNICIVFVMYEQLSHFLTGTSASSALHRHSKEDKKIPAKEGAVLNTAGARTDVRIDLKRTIDVSDTSVAVPVLRHYAPEDAGAEGGVGEKLCGEELVAEQMGQLTDELGT